MFLAPAVTDTHETGDPLPRNGCCCFWLVQSKAGARLRVAGPGNHALERKPGGQETTSSSEPSAGGKVHLAAPSSSGQCTLLPPPAVAEAPGVGTAGDGDGGSFHLQIRSCLGPRTEHPRHASPTSPVSEEELDAGQDHHEQHGEAQQVQLLAALEGHRCGRAGREGLSRGHG